MTGETRSEFDAPQTFTSGSTTSFVASITPEQSASSQAVQEPEVIDGLAGFPPEEIAGEAAEERVLLTVESHPIIGRTARYRVGTGEQARIVEVVTPPGASA